jgi:hypothetical protein
MSGYVLSLFFFFCILFFLYFFCVVDGVFFVVLVLFVLCPSHNRATCLPFFFHYKKRQRVFPSFWLNSLSQWPGAIAKWPGAISLVFFFLIKKKKLTTTTTTVEKESLPLLNSLLRQMSFLI